MNVAATHSNNNISSIEQVPANNIKISVTKEIEEIDKNAKQVNLQVKDLSKGENDTLTFNEISLEQIEKAVDQVDKIVQSINKRLSFFVDKESGRFAVKVIDKETNKVIRQIPPEEILNLSARIKEMVGILLDEKS
ncbi:MAG: flagellar protein FlaG [bacterium]